MADKEIGAAFRELRTQKGYTLKYAARGVVSVQFLSQFERGQSSISLARLAALLTNIHVSVVELASMPELSVINWLDLWAFQLDAVRRGLDDVYLDATIAPERLRPVVELVNRLAVVAPDERRNLLNRGEAGLIARTVTASKHYGVYTNLVVHYGAFTLASSLRRVAEQRLSEVNLTAELPYLQAGSTFGAMSSLVEVEIYLGNIQRAEQLLRQMRLRPMASDTAALITLRVLEAELALRRGDEAAANGLRDRLLGTLQLLGNQADYNRQVRYFDRVWRELGVRAHG
ncbi:helix-turn-helix domain-containing protein [Lacticaseibacillus songhuajiangensis]|jgi:transcriptional regulator with XRE-family HTH domain|uniref:helix-turn-helix domain-containing protein n=1 Tax=Lacticaseibacillus songhuajiangensis TaxID=1296539 RepID=UPI000F7AF098|nr:helix-turn-helix transcriptional regulator [Lacticaseibacillus songhuajiangensis]